MAVKLDDYQLQALSRMKNGCILCGWMGSGKSRTAIAYYFLRQGGSFSPYVPMGDPPKDLYIITTPKKRNDMEWEGDLAPFLLSTKSESNLYGNKVVVDSWNNIKKYVEVKDAFFIFDEQRVVGWGTWSKSFIKIAKQNEWIMATATPGDTWEDYGPVFVANGFFKNKTDYINRHLVYDWRKSYPSLIKVIDSGKLNALRRSILVNMDYKKPTVAHHTDILVDYDRVKYKDLMKNRFDYEKGEPIENASQLCYELRKISNSDEDRLDAVKDIAKNSPKMIIFYNFDYELELLRTLKLDLNIEVAEWNGHNHDKLPTSDRWLYLVQYTAGAEGWNCITTDTVIFYSQTYSYKTMVQASGRIDRRNTPFVDLYYYHLKSSSPIDIAISRALKDKRQFNERKFIGDYK